MSNSFSDFRYSTQDAIDEAWGITVTTAGYQEILPGAVHTQKTSYADTYNFLEQTGRILQEYQLIYITRGEGSFTSKSLTRTSLQAGHSFLIFPGEWHIYWPKKETGWYTYTVGFKGFYADKLASAGLFNRKQPVYRIGLHEKLVSLFRDIIEHSQSGTPASQQHLAGTVIYILSQIQAMSHNQKIHTDTASKVITNAKILMRENVYKQLPPEKIAQSLNVGYSLFRRMFKQHTGMAPAQYQQQLRLAKAKELLADSGKTIKEISFMLHFESDYYFSTYFKNKTGQTPSEFRKTSFGRE